jgi:hypothetical protein
MEDGTIPGRLLPGSEHVAAGPVRLLPQRAEPPGRELALVENRRRPTLVDTVRQLGPRVRGDKGDHGACTACLNRAARRRAAQARHPHVQEDQVGLESGQERPAPLRRTRPTLRARSRASARRRSRSPTSLPRCRPRRALPPDLPPQSSVPPMSFTRRGGMFPIVVRVTRVRTPQSCPSGVGPADASVRGPVPPPGPSRRGKGEPPGRACWWSCRP